MTHRRRECLQLGLEGKTTKVGTIALRLPKRWGPGLVPLLPWVSVSSSRNWDYHTALKACGENSVLRMSLAQYLVHSERTVIVNNNYYYNIICMKVHASSSAIYKTDNTLTEERVHRHQ